MKILVLNGSPHVRGNTAALINAFAKGARENGHEVEIFPVCQKKIAGCLGCEYCHMRGNGTCIQKDDMQELYPLIQQAEMLVIASPIYYFGLSGQLQCVIQRTHAIGVPRNLRKAALLLSSGASGVYDGAIYEYRQIVEYMNLDDAGICTAYGSQNKSQAKLNEAYQLGLSV